MPPSPQQDVVFWQPVLLLPLCCTFSSWPLAAGISAAIVPAGKQDMDCANITHVQAACCFPQAHVYTSMFCVCKSFKSSKAQQGSHMCTSHTAAVTRSSLHHKLQQLGGATVASVLICMFFHAPKECACS